MVSQNTTVILQLCSDLPYLLPHLHILNTTGTSQLKTRFYIYVHLIVSLPHLNLARICVAKCCAGLICYFNWKGLFLSDTNLAITQTQTSIRKKTMV
jgi:hypothetical protein